MKPFRVFVYNHHRGVKKRVNRPLTYTLYQGDGACLHDVEAERGSAAKKAASDVHLLMCEQDDRHCDRCRELGHSCLTEARVD